jgi:hypothetical protein
VWNSSRGGTSQIFIACTFTAVCDFSSLQRDFYPPHFSEILVGRVMQNKHICCSSLAMHQNSSADVTPGVEKTMRLGTHSPGAFYSAKKRLARLLHDGYNFMSC